MWPTTLMVAALVVALDNACAPLGPSTDARLEAVMRELPPPAGAVLVGRVNIDGGGNIQRCSGRQTQAVYGTDELSFDQILDYYTHVAQAKSWHLDLAAVKGRTFRMGQDEYLLEISNNYGLTAMGPAPAKEAQARYRTVYFFGLATHDILPVPDGCMGGSLHHPQSLRIPSQAERPSTVQANHASPVGEQAVLRE